MRILGSPAGDGGPSDPVPARGRATGAWQTVWASETDLDPRLVLKLHTGPMRAVAFAEIEQRPLAAVGLQQGGVRVGDLLSGELHELPCEEPVRSLAFARTTGDPLLLTGHREGKMRVWRLADGLPLRVVETGDHYVSELHVVETRVITRDSACQVRCWSLPDGEPVEVPGTGHACAVDVSGNTALLAGDDGMSLWDLETGRLSDLPVPPGLLRVRSVVLGHDCATVMDEAHRIATLDVATGELKAPFLEAHLNRHWDDLRDIFSIDTPHPPLAVVAGTLAVPAKWRVYLWDLTTSEQAAPTIAGPVAESMVRTVRWQGRDLLLTASAREGVVALWDLTEPVDRQPGHDQQISQVVTADPAGIVVSADEGGTILARDGSDGRLLAGPLATGVQNTRAVAAWLDGDRIIAAQGAGSRRWGDGRLRRWDLTTGEPYGPPFEAHTAFAHWIRHVALTDGEALVTFGPVGMLKLWRPHDGALIAEVQTPFPSLLTGLATAVVEGRPVAALSFKSQPLAVYTLDDLSAPPSVIPQAGDDVALCMTGPHIITVHASNVLRVWRGDGDQIGADIAGMAPITAAVARSWPAAYIGRADGTVALTDLETGEDLCPPMLLPTAPSTMAITAEGDLLVGFGSDVARLHPPAW